MNPSYYLHPMNPPELKPPSREHIFITLRTLGVTQVCMEFYGANDKGRVDSIDFNFKNGNRLSDVDFPFYTSLQEALEAPIHGFYDFNSEHSITGTLTWDVELETVTAWGNRTVDQAFTDEL